MKIIAGLDQQYQGNVVWSPGYSVGYLPQDPPLNEDKTVKENVMEGVQHVYDALADYDAINVNKTIEIPCDYDEVMGVPITFLDKYNPNQFKILGLSASAGYNKDIVGIDFHGIKDARPLINGKNTYARIFIKKK